MKFVGSTSAGCAIASAALLGRSREALGVFKDLTADNPSNVHWGNIFRSDPVLPHAAMYRSALSSFVGEEELKILQGTDLHFLMSAYPEWLGGTWAAAFGLSVYSLERHLINPFHPRWTARAGFTPVIGSAQGCESPEDFVNLIMAASCVPPFMPGGAHGGRPVLDGGLIDNVPLRLADGRAGNTLVLLSRRYDRPLPIRDGVTWSQPSRPIEIDKFDYANPEGLQDAFDLGLEDAQHFVQAQAELAS